MKKAIGGILILSLALSMIFPAAACDAAPAAQPILLPAMGETFRDPAWWAVTEDCRLAGIKDEGESLTLLGVQRVSGQWVAGMSENGWVREKAAVRIPCLNGQVTGLTRLSNVTITVWAEYVSLARATVEALFGEGAALSAAAIAAGATWRAGEYAAMIFAPSYAERTIIGCVSFNGGQDTTPLCIRTFGGQQRFALIPGWQDCPAQPPITQEQLDEAEAARAQAEAWAYAEAQARAEAEARASAAASAQARAEARAEAAVAQATAGNGDGCNRNNNVIQVGISLFGDVKNWLGIGNKGGCE